MSKRGRKSGKARRQEGEGGLANELMEEVQAGAIQSALMAFAPSTGLRVDVDVEDGVVYLRGEVASEEQKSNAERIVRDMELHGVREIRNELTVNPGLPRLPHP